MMRRIPACALLLAVVLLARPAWAAEEAKASKTGGSFEVEVHKDIPYVEGKDADERPEARPVPAQGGQGLPDPVLHPRRRLDGRLAVGLRQASAAPSPATAWPSSRSATACRPRCSTPPTSRTWPRASPGRWPTSASTAATPDAIFVSGHSAGGHLAALLATDDDYLKAEKLSLSNIKGVIPVSGVFVVSTRMKNVFGDDAEVCKKASPQNHVRDGPAAVPDPLRRQRTCRSRQAGGGVRTGPERAEGRGDHRDGEGPQPRHHHDEDGRRGRPRHAGRAGVHCQALEPEADAEGVEVATRPFVERRDTGPRACVPPPGTRTGPTPRGTSPSRTTLRTRSSRCARQR